METIRFINILNEYYNTEIKNDLVNDFEVPYTTMNIGLINGGETLNSVPGKCYITIDFRVVKESHLTVIKEKIDNILQSFNANLIVRETLSPKLNNSDISFLEEISQKKETKCYLTEGSVIDKNFIILGPGPDTSHQKNEYITYDKLKETEYLYQTIVEYYNKNS
jgi:acetylornithine deacetylase